MLFFSLPGFFHNFRINNFFITLSKTYPQYFKAPVTFSEVTGNFPYNYWNGGYNNCLGEACTYNSVFDCHRACDIPIRLNCANILLSKTEDFYDTINHTILSLCHNSSNYIEVSTLDLLYFLQEKYPHYQFVFSKEADLIVPFSSDIVNAINEKQCFRLVSLPERVSCDIEFLQAIKRKHAIELTVNTTCDFKCFNYESCAKMQHLNQYNYSGENPQLLCQKRVPYHQGKVLLDLDTIVNDYVPMGITHFRLAEVAENPRDRLLIFLVKYFIKEEYQTQVFEMSAAEGIW